MPKVEKLEGENCSGLAPLTGFFPMFFFVFFGWGGVGLYSSGWFTLSTTNYPTRRVDKFVIPMGEELTNWKRKLFEVLEIYTKRLSSHKVIRLRHHSGLG